jgi:FeS assembly SUF system protein
MSENKLQTIVDNIVAQIRTCFDPEIPVNIYDLGLIYEINLDENGKADIDMTLTSPMCPVAGTLPEEVRQKALLAEGVTEASINLVWEPPWDPELMSDEAKLELGIL